jgi:predicted RNA-binding protein Jag
MCSNKTQARVLAALQGLLNAGEYDNAGNYVIVDTGEYVSADDETLIPEIAEAVMALRQAQAEA